MRGLAAALLATAALAAGCGSDSSGGDGADGGVHDVSIALDFTPNAVHAPIYAAIREGIDRKAGVRLRIRQPGQSPDSLKDVLSGRADLGLLDIQDLGLAVADGKDVVAVAALVQKPLSALIALPRITRPRDLEGERVGVSGLPSDPAFLAAIMRDDGGDPARAEQVTIGFSAVQSLISGRVAAVPAFWSSEGVALRRRGVRIREFRVERYGAPPFPEVVLVARRETVEKRTSDVRAAVLAIAGGMVSVLNNPTPAVRDIASASGAPQGLVRAQLRAVAPVLGVRLDLDVLDRWSAWAADAGLLPERVDVGRAFDPQTPDR